MAKESTEETVNNEEVNQNVEQTVPKERLDELNSELSEKNEALETVRQNVAILEAQGRINAQASAGPPPDRIKEAMKNAGLDPDDPKDLANQDQLHKILTQVGQDIQQETAVLAFIVEHPDYPKIVGTRDMLARGEYAAPLKKAIKANPALKNVIASAANRQYAAYQIAKQFVDAEPAGGADGAQAIIDEAVNASTKVKSSANTSGGTALSNEGQYAEGVMSDEEFFETVQKNGAQL